MKPGNLQTVIIDQMEDTKRIFSSENIIEREFFYHWDNVISTDLVKVIYGVRRCGKSIFSFQLLEQRESAYINFDDERLAGIKTDDLDEVVQAFYQVYGDTKYILLDEIQNIPGWELFVSRLMRQGFNVVITGSSANLLSKELATHLTGRYLPLGIFPFSYREFLAYRGIRIEKEKILGTRTKSILMKNLYDYLETGGFPEALKYPDYRRKYLSTLYSDIISKDVVGRFNIRYIRTLKDIANYVISNFSNLMTYNRIKNKFELKSVHTVKNYLSYLEDASIIIMVDKYSSKHRGRIVSPKKVYVVDVGVAQAVAFFISKNFGLLMENIVAIELFRKKAQDPAIELFYWRDYQQHEVDFIIKRGQNIERLIQVSYANSDDDINKREIRALLKASEDLKCGVLTVITWDYLDEREIAGKDIHFIPLWHWLFTSQ